MDHIPSLRANILEVANPRQREARLLDQLKQRLDRAATGLPRTAASGGAESDDAAVSVREDLEAANELVSEISKLNEEHSGPADGILARALDAVIPGGGTVPFPSAATPAPCVAN